MSQFDFLKLDKKFNTFSDTCIAAEKILAIDPRQCAIACRTALEFAVKWLYKNDTTLVMPYQDNLKSLVMASCFVELIPNELNLPIKNIINLGNFGTHNPTRAITESQAKFSLQNLFAFMDFIAYCYSEHYETPYVSKVPDPTEAQTRKQYIDIMLLMAGWEKGKNWIDEYPIDEMTNVSNNGFADYVLLGDDNKPLAIVEAKRTSVDIEKGRQQAVLYADFLEKKFKRRPIIFLTNGYETKIWNDKVEPERPISGVYSKRDLEQLFNKMQLRTPLDYIIINDNITNRYYQKEAIKAVCEKFDRNNKRKALLVMATGSGKTRTVISIVDVLIRHGWVKNLLFLADRNSLVTQAKRNFNFLLPDLSLCNFVESKSDPNARAIFSTYQTMMNCIDETKGDDGNRLFTCGHFDLIIVDEAHRSIYNKYKDIFTYFDALLIGLTATPKDEIDKNTYDIFGLESGVPTYGYELSCAVEDKYLVNYESIRTKLKFMFDGITYKDLPDDEKEQYEETFVTEDGQIPEKIDSSAFNEWLFNKDTIRLVLNILMTNGHKVDFGNKIGKTIIFAKSHKHAEKILEVWNDEYPNYPQHYCRVIDNYTNYAQSLIDDFSEANKLPQIAISVDMLDTGIDIPELLNLVFFKKVMSKGKFWQMIGRGTRLCENILDGEDKKNFYIFDFCNNFEFFEINKKGKEAITITSIQERIFNLKTEIIFKLQDLAYQTTELKLFREELVDDLIKRINTLCRDNFAVRQHLRYIDKYSDKAAFTTIDYEDTLKIAEHISPLIEPDKDEISAVRFDALIYQIELAYLIGKTFNKQKGDLLRKVSALTELATIPEIVAKSELIQSVLNSGYVGRAGINEFEKIRNELRDLMKFIKNEGKEAYTTNFTDDVLSIEWHKSDLENDDLKDYKKKVNYYIRQNQDNEVIAKLKHNIPLTKKDVEDLECILWSEVGTKNDYQNEYGDKPLGELVRSIVGLDIVAANEAFSSFLNDVNLTSQQIYFVKQIINYIVQNGTMSDLSVLTKSPFSDMGGVSELFDNVSIFMNIRKTIEKINKNAVA